MSRPLAVTSLAAAMLITGASPRCRRSRQFASTMLINDPSVADEATRSQLQRQHIGQHGNGAASQNQYRDHFKVLQENDRELLFLLRKYLQLAARQSSTDTERPRRPGPKSQIQGGSLRKPLSYWS
jgi:hypothetical protein